MKFSNIFVFEAKYVKQNAAKKFIWKRTGKMHFDIKHFFVSLRSENNLNGSKTENY
jgi:hypothetical protein